MNNFIDVKTFGARGDGITDDTLAIQTAIDLSPQGSSIWLSPGDYLVSKTIILNKPSMRINGSNGGSFRSNKFGDIPATTKRSNSNLIGITPEMIVLQSIGPEQAGPVISDLAIWDIEGMKSGSSGTMTLLSIYNVNRWSLRNIGLFWGDVGIKLQKGLDGDNAGWVIDQIFAMGCNIGGVIDTFSGHWRDGWISLCGIGLNIDLTEGVRPSSIRISGIKFDILDTSKPGIGVRVGTIGTLLINSCIFENQPGALAKPKTTAILIDPIDSQSTCVTICDCVSIDNDYGINCFKARYLKISGFIRRITNSMTGGTSPISIQSASQLSIEPVILL